MFDMINKAKNSFDCLTVYRGLLQESVFNSLYLVLDGFINKKMNFDEFVRGYCDFYFKFIELNQGNSFKDYIIDCIIFKDNAFSRTCEKTDFNQISENILRAVKTDLRHLELISSIKALDIKQVALKEFVGLGYEADIIADLPEWDIDSNEFSESGHISHQFKLSNNWGKMVKELGEFHKQNGSGEFALYKGFIWEHQGESGRLKGIKYPDPVRFSDLIGYELEREVVTANTLQFLKGYPANNVLLYGDRGTGKSSTVKALLNEYNNMGLRIIEVPKIFLSDFHLVLRTIKDRQQKFIIFIDDLAFEDSEENYTALKAVLEGSLESKPSNLIIYATSNRRNLIKEKFSDRKGLVSANHDDEVNAGDTMQEKLSLADRFGIIVTFSSPDKKTFLEIVEGLVRNRNLSIAREELHMEALKWEITYNGRSPRTAHQFVDWLEGQQGMLDSNHTHLS